MSGADPSPSSAVGPAADATKRPVEPAAALAEARRRVLTRLGRLTADHAGIVAASRDSNADDEHDPEGATIAFERSQVASLVDQARAHLAEIDAAQARLRRGTYGVCEVCGTTVGAARLGARPAARTCLACASGSGRGPRGDLSRG